MPELHPAQFADQMALPGMEHLAHPWAKPLSRGLRLHYSEGTFQNHLQAVRGPHKEYADAEMDWANRRNTGGSDSYHPGEIAWIHNGTNVSGVGEALMRSAHHFDFGQDTVPIHSPERTTAGKRFSDRVMPELKPDIWQDSQSGLHYEEGNKWGENRRTPQREPKWNLPENFHPHQQQAASKERAAAAQATRKPPQKEKLPFPPTLRFIKHA